MEHITFTPIAIANLLSSAHNPQAGAVVLFSGEVRNHHEGKSVEYLEYEAHGEMADVQIQKILDEALAKWDLHSVECIHRLGRINISESAVCVITASSHRKEAYEANRWIIDQVKHNVPIWKREFFTDGTTAWVMQCKGCEEEHEALHHRPHSH